MESLFVRIKHLQSLAPYRSPFPKNSDRTVCTEDYLHLYIQIYWLHDCGPEVPCVPALHMESKNVSAATNRLSGKWFISELKPEAVLASGKETGSSQVCDVARKYTHDCQWIAPPKRRRRSRPRSQVCIPKTLAGWSLLLLVQQIVENVCEKAFIWEHFPPECLRFTFDEVLLSIDRGISGLELNNAAVPRL